MTTTRIIRLLFLAILAGLMRAVLGSADTGDKPRNHIIRVGPKAYNLSEAAPARLSIGAKNTINWVSERPLRINFRLEDFPILKDGSRVTIPPLEDMSLGMSKESWLPNSGPNKVNPALRPVLDQSADRELTYRYRVMLDDSWGYALLIVQE